MTADGTTKIMRMEKCGYQNEDEKWKNKDKNLRITKSVREEI